MPEAIRGADAVRLVEDVRRATKQGLRQGKWGFPVTKCPYAPSDRSPEAVAWRKGWTLGNAAFRQQTEGSR